MYKSGGRFFQCLVVRGLCGGCARARVCVGG